MLHKVFCLLAGSAGLLLEALLISKPETDWLDLLGVAKLAAAMVV